MRHLILPSLLFLTACAHNTPGIKVETVEVVREVQKPCPGDKPARPEPLARPLPTDPVALAALLAAKLGEWSLPGQYGDKADAIIDRCLNK